MFTAMPHWLPASCVCEFVALHQPAPVVIVGAFAPVVTLYFSCDKV